MAFKIITGVKETVSGQSGTGSFSSDGADGNYLAANSQLSNGDSSVFIIRSTDEPETQREIFVGTLTTGTPDSFSRDTTIYSSNGGFGGSSITLDAGKTYTLAGVVDPSHTVLDITSLTAETLPADDDELAIYDASANLLRKMTRSNLLQLTKGANVTTTSGSTAEFTGIPNWVNRITIQLNGVSTNGTGTPQLQLGTSGSYVTSGYSGAAQVPGVTAANFSAAFNITLSNASSDTRHGIVTLERQASNVWCYSSSIALSNASEVHLGAGSVDLGGTLTRLRVQTSDTFDGGAINIIYE